MSLSDWARFAPCMGGPATPAGTDRARAYLNRVGVVDLRDVGIFQFLFGRRLVGPKNAIRVKGPLFNHS